MKYKVYVDDNFNYMDEDERYIAGEFETEEEAIAYCKKNVDDFLLSIYIPGMTKEKLLDQYKSFGEDPYIMGIKFSAWDYAENKCGELCDDNVHG